MTTRMRPAQTTSASCPITKPQPGQEEVAVCIDCTYYPIDKIRRLSSFYAPRLVDTSLPGGGKLVPEANEALVLLFADAHTHGIKPVITSAYRSYEDQVSTFNWWLTQEFGHRSNVDLALDNVQRYSARPGHSEHQLGTTVDLNCDTCAAFDDKDVKNIALWNYLEDNAFRFGFVISYPRDQETRTGYKYEPWHIRFVGVALSSELFSQGYLQGNPVCLMGLLRSKKLY